MSPNRTSSPQITSGKQLRSRRFGPLRWLWHGYLVSGAITLLTSQWKAGKTTLLAALLSQMESGGELAGAEVGKGRALVVSEEDDRIWSRRQEKFALGNHVNWIFRPFAGPPSMTDWLDFAELILKRQRRRHFELIVIDPLATMFPPETERNAAVLLEALAPLRKLATQGAAVLLLHHPRKGRPTDVLVPRGSGVLPITVDVLMELNRTIGANASDRRRWVRGLSRYEETAHERLIELNDAGTKYHLLSDPNASEFESAWRVLKTVFEDANHRLNRHAVLSAWPRDHDKPSPATLWRWLDRALALGLIARHGAGRRTDPFLYWLPGRELFLLPDLPPLDPMEWGRRLEADRLAEERLEEFERRRMKRRRGNFEIKRKRKSRSRR